jgi:hypothetical protein
MTRDSDKKPPRRPGPFRGPFSPLWFGAVLFALLLIANALSTTFNRTETLDYSAFKSLLAQGRIAEVQLGLETIRGKYQDADGSQKDFSAVRVEDPNLADLLDAQKVRYAGEVSSQWVTELLGWVFPIRSSSASGCSSSAAWAAPRAASCRSRAAARRSTPKTT